MPSTIFYPEDPGDPGGPGGPGDTGGGGGGGTGVPGTVIHEFDFDKVEADSTLRIIGYFSAVSGDDLQFTVYIGIDDNIVQVATTNIIGVSYYACLPITVPAFVPDIDVGTRHITFSVANFEHDSALTILAGYAIEVTELKRAAR